MNKLDLPNLLSAIACKATAGGKKTVSIALSVLLFAFLLGRCTGGTSSAPSSPQASNLKPKVSIWTCSMHPQIKLPKAGKCPICFMDLIELEPGGDEGGEREIRVSAYSAKLMELETTEVTRRFAAAEVRMVGRVNYDETRVSYITAWMPGRLDNLFVDYTGVQVEKGDHMVSIYSPELLSAQQELLQAIESVKNLRNSDLSIVREASNATVEASREKLRLWGLTAEQIQAIETHGSLTDHVTLTAPVGGIVIHKNAQKGMYVKTGDRIYTVADFSRVWVELDAYESDLNGLRYGGTVEFSTEAYPGEVFEGTLSFIDPIINPATRTAKVRVIVENPTFKLKPGMFVRAIARPKIAEGGHVMDSGLAGKWISPMHPEVIKDGPGSCDVCGMPLVTAESLGYVSETKDHAPLLIPVTAALKTGKRSVVYVEIPDAEKPSYEGREVRLGQRLGDLYVVEEGLEEGERVVTRGAFKLDAELQIRAKPSMMSAPSEKDEMAGMDHDAMQADTQPVDVPNAFAQQLEAAVQVYFDIQQALGTDSTEAAKTAAEAFKEKLQKIDMGLLKGDGHMIWMDHLMNLNAATIQLQNASSIEMQRAAFYPLSQQLVMTLRVFPIQLPVQQAFCPMAFDNAGAIWLQQSREILNPYFGAAMSGCGEFLNNE